jgi:hypothetical protein
MGCLLWGKQIAKLAMCTQLGMFFPSHQNNKRPHYLRDLTTIEPNFCDDPSSNASTTRTARQVAINSSHDPDAGEMITDSYEECLVDAALPISVLLFLARTIRQHMQQVHVALSRRRVGGERLPQNVLCCHTATYNHRKPKKQLQLEARRNGNKLDVLVELRRDAGCHNSEYGAADLQRTHHAAILK